MINIVNGNILNCKEDIIVHQVNVNGLMGGGLARQLADQYSDLEKEYRKFCKHFKNDYEILKGTVTLYCENKKFIANIFSQEPNFNTDYKSMQIALTKVRKYAEKNKLSVAIPYKIGCGIANGVWEYVLDIINIVFKDYKVTIYRLEEN